jgi:UDP-N-acetyl-D-mannosaminuronic acid dehydrogenase
MSAREADRAVAVIGVGHVGLPLAVALAAADTRVIAVDTSCRRLEELRAGRVHEPEQALREAWRGLPIDALTLSETVPRDATAYIICVPTSPSADDRYACRDVLTAARAISNVLATGDLVIVRSTVHPGATRDLIRPMLESSGLAAGQDFCLAVAPERGIEGAAYAELFELPQLVAGLGECCTSRVAALLDFIPVFEQLASIEAAELAKLALNVYRDVRFAYANLLAELSANLDVDPAAMIERANRGYPRDSLPMPSAGVGGPCLPKDSAILTETLTREGVSADLLLSARAINTQTPRRLWSATEAALVSQGLATRDDALLFSGMAFKGRPLTDSLYESPGVALALAARAAGWTVFASDPVVDDRDLRNHGLVPIAFADGVRTASAVVICNNRELLQSELRALQGPSSLKAVYDISRGVVSILSLHAPWSDGEALTAPLHAPPREASTISRAV